jgi:hypothetical protein
MYRVQQPGGRRWLLEQVARRPLPLAEATGFVVSHSERSRLGWVERLVAVKPAV